MVIWATSPRPKVVVKEYSPEYVRGLERRIHNQRMRLASLSIENEELRTKLKGLKSEEA